MFTLNTPLSDVEGSATAALISESLTTQGVKHKNIRYMSTSMNHAFTDDEYVFCKLLGPRRDTEGFEAEIKIGNNPDTLGLTTRSLLPSYININDTPLTAFEYVKGVSVQENDLTSDQVIRILNALTEYHVRTEEPTNKLNMPLLNDVAQYTEWFMDYENDKYASEVKLTQQLVRQYIYPMHELNRKDNSILHADVRSPNFIFTTTGETLLCDFESALFGAPEYDYGLLAFNLDTHNASSEVWDAYYDYVTHHILDYKLIVQSANVKLVKAIIANFAMKNFDRAQQHLNYLTHPHFID